MKHLSSKTKIFAIIVGGLLLEIILTRGLQKVSENWAISQCGPVCELEGLALFGTFFFGGHVFNSFLLASLTFLVARMAVALKHPVLIFILLVLFYFFPGGLLSLLVCNPL